MKKRFLILTLCVLLALSLAVSASAAEPEGSFVLTVCTANNIVIEPVRVSYTAGQSVKEALLNSGFEFEGLEESNFIYSIEGAVANYVILFDNGNVRFDTPASEVTVIRIGVIDVLSDYCEDMISMIKTMADYNDMENHVQNYQPASTAYNGCLYGIRGDGSEAAALKAELESAISDYEDILSGAKYTVTVNATQYGYQLPSPVITMTDAYGNITTNTGSSIQVIAGDYTFSVSDGGYNRTEGTIKVRDNTTVSTALPEGEWFGEMMMRSYYYVWGFHEPYRCEQDTKNHKTTFFVDDTAHGYYDTNLVVFIGDVPDQNKTYLRTIYTSIDGRDFSNSNRSWANSTGTYGNYLNALVDEGMEGRTFSIEAQYKNSESHTQIQSYEIEIIRVPTLKDMTIESEGSQISLGNEIWTNYPGTEPELYAITFESGTWEYYVTTIADVIDIHTEPFDGAYEVSGNGMTVVEPGTSIHEVTVTAPNGMSSIYRLQITRVAEVSVLIEIPTGTSAEITNNIGSVFTPVDGQYYLVPGETYTCTATKNKYYHSEVTFIAADGLTIQVPEPIIEDWLDDIGVYSGRGRDDNNVYCLLPYTCNQVFESATHEYSYSISNCNTTLYIQTNIKSSLEPANVFARYTDQSGRIEFKSVEILYNVDPTGVATSCPQAVTKTGYGNDIVIRVESQRESVLYYQDYNLACHRILHLLSMEIFADGETPVLYDVEENITEFDREILDYYFLVNRDLENITLDLAFPIGSPEVYSPGYYSYINDNRFDCEAVYTDYGDQIATTGMVINNAILPLDADKTEESVTIRVCHIDPTAEEVTYTLHMRKSAPVPVAVSITPSDAVVFLTNDANGKRVLDDNRVYMLTPGASYSYNATRTGYIGIQGSYSVPANGGVLSITLEVAPEGAPLANLSAQWPNLRRDENNNAVTNAPSPVQCDQAALYWAVRLGEGWSGEACSPPILVDGYLYVYAGRALYKVDPYTGDIVASASMVYSSNFAINPPTYANGMIFVGLANGIVQAFNASTLESLWVYQAPLKGQPNCSITYHNGYVYTGFWMGETSDANFVCLSVTDEDPSNPLEKKLATWTYTSPGGFYWAGAYVSDNYLLIGTDDGCTAHSNSARLLSFDPTSGALLDSITLPGSGDIRSSIMRYNGKYYFTSKGGYFYEAVVNNDGTIQEVRSIDLGGMSTSTPVIYNGRAYVGVCGAGQFITYTGHKIDVIDVKNWEIAYSVPTQGYPQTSGALTTYYEGTTGNVYVYFFDNFTPGKLRILEDKLKQTSATMITSEYSHNVAYNLFEPIGGQAQFAICSPVIDEYGTMYFKNDSGYLMAVGSTVDHLEITKQPDKLTYKVGETFDSTGMKVTAHFSNGTSRDVTQYMTWSTEPLITEDTDFQLLYPIVMYQNEVKDGVVQAGITPPAPMAIVTLTIESELEILFGDVNGDKRIDMLDARLVVESYAEEITLSNDQEKAADVDGNRQVNMMDFYYIVLRYAEEITEFPVENQP